MIECKEIQDYIDFCEANPDRINKERQQLIENIVKPTIARDDIYFNREMYEKCIRFCESNYYALFPYQKFIYAFVFMYLDDEPLFSTFFIFMGRGNGKDGMLMPLANFLLTPMHGIKNYNIDIIANNEDQARNSFNVVYNMLENPKFKKMFYRSKKMITNYKTNSSLRYNTSQAKTKDGKQGGALIFNELHAYENYDQINVFTSQLGKIASARTFIITTQGYVRDGPLDDYLSTCRTILRTGENEIGYFPFLWNIDDRDEYENEVAWEKANPSLPYRPYLKRQLKKDFLELKTFASKRAEFMTKRMNLPDRDDEVTVATWDNIMRATYADIELKTPRATPSLDNELCIIGIDFADIRDFASAGLLFKVDGEYIWRQHTWICSNSPFFKNIKFPISNIGLPEFEDFEVLDEPSISVVNIVKWCLEQAKTHQVQKIVMDTYRFSLFRECFEAMGVEVESRTNPYGMVRMIRNLNSINTLTAPIIEKAFTDNKINFGSSAIMRWYTNNTSVSIDKYGNKTYGKVEPKLRKNDGFMAFVVAMSAESLLDQQVLII